MFFFSWRIFTFTNAMTCFNIRTWNVDLNLTENMDYFSSRFSSLTSSGIPVISKLFLFPYCSKWFPFISSDITLFSRFFTFMRKRWFSSWRSFMITSFKLSNSLFNPSKRESIFFSRLIIKLDVCGSNIIFFIISN